MESQQRGIRREREQKDRKRNEESEKEVELGILRKGGGGGGGGQRKGDRLKDSKRKREVLGGRKIVEALKARLPRSGVVK